MVEQARIERSVTLEVGTGAAWDRIVGRFSMWFGEDAALEPRPGGTVRCGARAGHVTGFEPGVRLAWEWSGDGDPGWTAVDMTLRPGGDGTTQVTVVEVLHQWEHERYGALGTDGAGRLDLMAVAR